MATVFESSSSSGCRSTWEVVTSLHQASVIPLTPQGHLGIIATAVARLWKKVPIHLQQYHAISKNKHVMLVGELRYEGLGLIDTRKYG